MPHHSPFGGFDGGDYEYDDYSDDDDHYYDDEDDEDLDFYMCVFIRSVHLTTLNLDAGFFLKSC